MRRALPATAAAAAIAVAAIGATAFAAKATDTQTASAKATSGGSAKTPKNVSASFKFAVSGANGARSTTPTSFSWTWSGISAHGSKFPTCTAAKIDAAQSDSVCPKGSLVASGTVSAVLGPENDRTQSVGCNKQVAIYNAGPSAEDLYLFGAPSACAGVSYLAPSPIKVKHSSSGDVFVLELPDNIAHPLPGLEGAFSKFAIAYKNVPVGTGKKATSYLTSTGCGSHKSRSFSFTQTYAQFDDAVSPASAGKC